MANTPSLRQTYADDLRLFYPETDKEKILIEAIQRLADSITYNRPVVTFSEAANPGQLVHLYNDGLVLTAELAEAGTPKYAFGFVSATSPVTAGMTGEVTLLGNNLYMSGLIPGAAYYLSNTPGEVSLTPGTNAQIVGVAYSDSILFQNFGTALSGMPSSVQLAIREDGALISPTASQLDFIRFRISNVGSAITIEPEWQELKLVADEINANGVADTLQDTGLEFLSNGVNLYEFFVRGFYDAASTATGCRFTLDGPALTSLALVTSYTGVLAEAISTYVTPPAASTSNATTGNIVEMRGFIRTSASGLVKVRFASEVALSAITLKESSYIQWRVV